MTSDRVYRKALGAEVSRKELRRGSASQFDPEVVRAFLKILERGAEQSLGAVPAER